MLESRTDAEVAALDTDRIAFDLDLLFWSLLQKEPQHQVARNELRATERLRRLAEKHEDLALAQGLADDAAYLQTVIPVYATRSTRCLRQWTRYWDALLKHRLPDELYEALDAIALVERRTLLEQLTLVVQAGVTQWQAGRT
jgi:hypothetical protein